MKIRFSNELFALLTLVLLLGLIAILLLSMHHMKDSPVQTVLFDAVVKEDTTLLGESGQSYIYILRDGEEQCIDISQDTRITDEDGRKLDLTEGVELKMGQPIQVKAKNLIIYEPVYTYVNCFSIVILSP